MVESLHSTNIKRDDAQSILSYHPYSGLLLIFPYRPLPQVAKTHPGVRAASQRCGEDPSERQAVPGSGVCPRGAQEAHHVLHRRSRPPWPTTSSHGFWAHPTLYQVTNHIIFSAGALLLLALPMARAWPPPTPLNPTLQAHRWPRSVITGGAVA